jgi:hypothetical protein
MSFLMDLNYVPQVGQFLNVYHKKGFGPVGPDNPLTDLYCPVEIVGVQWYRGHRGTEPCPECGLPHVYLEAIAWSRGPLPRFDKSGPLLLVINLPHGEADQLDLSSFRTRPNTQEERDSLWDELERRFGDRRVE